MSESRNDFFRLGLADDLKEVVVDNILGSKSSWKLKMGVRINLRCPRCKCSNN